MIIITIQHESPRKQFLNTYANVCRVRHETTSEVDKGVYEFAIRNNISLGQAFVELDEIVSDFLAFKELKESNLVSTEYMADIPYAEVV